MTLDAAQEAVVQGGDGACLVIAPPGSGKTHTLTERIYFLVTERQVPAERILALTFTVKAARELRERLLRRFGENAALPYSATFHALALDMLRGHGETVGLSRDFSVAAEEGTVQNTATISFDDLLTYAVRLLMESPEARLHWQERFNYILVDEYQDTNRVQSELCALFAERHGNLCVIGDPDQAIYGFRGAAVENILEFESRYPDAVRHTLTRNYRSSPEIVTAAHALISRNSGRLADRAPETVRKAAGVKPTLARFHSPREEARYVAHTVGALIGGTYHPDAAPRTRGTLPLRESPYHPGEVAVVYRLNALGSVYANAFEQAGIPYARATEATIDKVSFDTFRVPLLTMHAAKGLEFPVVFAVGLEDGVMPYFKNADDETTERTEEERRLLYVAMTRAKERLFLTHCAERMLFGKRFIKPSRFLSEVPARFLTIEKARRREKPYQRKLF